VVEQLHAHNMPNLGTPCNTKSAQTVLYTKGAHTGHKKRMANNNIADLRKAKGWTQEQLADAIGTTINNLGKLERGARRLNQDWIDRIAGALECQPDDIIKASPRFTPPSGQRAGEQPLDIVRAPEQMPTRSAWHDAGPVQLRRVNLELAMGDGTVLEDWIEEEPYDFDATKLREITTTPARRLLIGKGIGDSMEPLIGNHDDVMINLDEDELKRFDGIYALTIEGAGAIKRLSPAGDGMVEVISENPAHANRVRTFPRSAIKIIGRIVWSARRH